MALNDTLVCTNFSALSEDDVLSCLKIRDGEIQNAINVLWVIYTGIGILSLQAGFTMLEAGTVQAKNVKSALMKNITDSVFNGLIWWFIGYGIYSGDGEFISGEPYLFFITDFYREEFPAFVQQFGFAATAGTIVSGAVLSRIKFEYYILFSILFTPLVYSVVAHVAWADNGFFYVRGYQDFAGSGVVHMIGGVAGFVGAAILGPRSGRFYAEDEEAPGAVRRLLPHSTALIVLGGLLLYIGWFSFNAGSSGGLGPGDLEDANRAAMNTLLGSAAGGAATTVYSIYFKRQHDVPLIINGLLSGLVAITGPSSYVDTWASLVIGALAGLTYITASYTVLHRLGIDDPVDAFAVHGVSGALGVILTGVFSFDGGLIYSGSADLLIVQLFAAGVFIAYSAGVTFVIFMTIRLTVGLRLPFDDQVVGLDDTYHHGSAYPEFDYLTVRAVETAKRRESVRQAGSNRLSFNPRHGSEVSSSRKIHFV